MSYETKEKREPFTEGEIELFISKCRDVRERLCVVFLFDTGCRKNELKRLRREWCDFSDRKYPFGTVTVEAKGKGDYKPIPEKQRKNIVSEFKPRGIKTKQRRTIPLTKRLNIVLQEFFKEYKQVSKHDTYVNELFARLTKDAGMQHHRLFPHLCRHTYITAAVNAGAEPFDLTEFTGHSGTKTLEDTYLHQKGDRAGKKLNDNGFLDK